MKRIVILVVLFSVSYIIKAQDKKSILADQISWVGHAISEEYWHIWGCSPIHGEDGKIHLFCARWPKETTHFGWKTHSQIAHYVAERPEGPFVFADVVLECSEKNTWDKYAPHNPLIKKVGARYVLFYIANDGTDTHPSNQKIGMLLSESLYGPWTKAGKNGLVLSPSNNPSHWTYKASNGVNNPAFIEAPDGRFYLYYKSEKAKMGLAIADNLEGPYKHQEIPVTNNERRIEDGYAFRMNGKYYLLTTDNHGMIREGGGLLWSSDDGVKFDNVESGFHLLADYLPEGYPFKPKYVKGRLPKLERPQVLMMDSKPAYLYMPSQCNIDGKEVSDSYVLKIDWRR